MSRHRVTGGTKVRGACAAGHITEATSDPGRTTWEGTCAHDGCELTVKARRIPNAPDAKEPPEPATAEPTKPTIKQVDYGTPPPKSRQRRPAQQRREPAKRTQQPEPAGPDHPAAPVQPSGGDGSAGGPGDPEPTGRGFRARLAAARARDRAGRSREFQLPF